jgi:hypothetical protein
MNRERLTALLQEADLHVAERRAHIDSLRRQVAELERDGHPADDACLAVERLEQALALYLEHREQLAKEVRD